MHAEYCIPYSNQISITLTCLRIQNILSRTDLTSLAQRFWSIIRLLDPGNVLYGLVLCTAVLRALQASLGREDKQI